MTLALTLTPYSSYTHPRQVAKALSLSPPRVAVREVRGGAFVVFDLLPAATTAAAAAGGAARTDAAAAMAAAQAAADVLALEVVELLLAEGGPLYAKGAAAGNIDPRYGELTRPLPLNLPLT